MYTIYALVNISFLFCFVFVFYRSTFVGSAWSFGFFFPATMANDLRLRRIFIPDLIHCIIFLSSFFRKSQYFPSVLNKGTTGTISVHDQSS